MAGFGTVIIGGGVAGASVARHLATRGYKDIVVIDRAPSLGMGSTGQATGGVRAQFETEINIRQSLYSIDFFREWEFDCEYDPKGYLFLTSQVEQLRGVGEAVERQNSLGYDDVFLVDKETIAKIAPMLNVDDVIGGSFGLRDGFINPLAVLEGFIREASLCGARVSTSTEAVSIDVTDGKVVSVTTTNGVIDCDNVVICTGAWSRDLAYTAGVDLPVFPQRRQLVWARIDEPLPAGMPMIIDLTNGFHFRPAKNFHFDGEPATGNDVLFAFPDRYEPTGTSLEVDDAFVQKALLLAERRSPMLAGAIPDAIRCRAGLYENTPDHHAILGGCGVDGLYMACGFSGHGVMHSPAAGRAVAEIILDGESSFMDVSALRLSRFETGDLLQESGYI